MTKIKAIETTLNAMHDDVQKLINAELDKEGLDRLVNDAQDLYEKMIVLRYKAYEEKVFGASVDPEDIEVLGEQKSEAKEESFFDGIEKVIPIEEKAEDLANNTTTPEPVTEAPSFDFSLFDNDEKEESTDASTETADEELKVEESVETKTENPQSEEEQPRIVLDDTEEVKDDEEEVVEKESIFDHKEQETKAERSQESAEPAVEPTLEPRSFSSSEPPIGSQEQNLSTTENWVQEQFINKFSKIDADQVQQLSISKLSTLLGAFGLNERLQCINELFDGSSEAFGDAIKALDNAGSLDAAIKLASELSVKYEWDLNSETVEEFVFKIKRRYA